MKKKSPWKRVDKEVPGMCVDVLLWDEMRIWLGWNDSDKTEDPSFVVLNIDPNGRQGARSLEGVTHWRPLPEPPTGLE